MSNLSSNINHNESASFDLFAKPETDDLAEHLSKGSYQWTNKYTRILGIAAIVVTLLSAGAWYGHHSATSAANSSLGTSINALRSAFGGAGATGAGTGAPSGRAAGGGFGGPRVTGSITKVSNGEVTIKLDDSTQASTLKTGDSARVTDTAGFGAPFTGGGTISSAPSAPSAKTTMTPTRKPGATQPSVGGSSGGRTGFFSDPTIQACLKKAGVVITPGVRPDRADPKIAAAFAKCLPGFGTGRATP
jgi:hypothetical protein